MVKQILVLKSSLNKRIVFKIKKKKHVKLIITSAINQSEFQKEHARNGLKKKAYNFLFL